MWLLVSSGGTRTIGDLLSIVTSMAGLYHTTFMGQLKDNLHLTQVLGRWKTPGGHIEATWEGDFSGADTTSQGSPGQTSALINWFIESFYRGGHPRSYIPGLPNNAVVDDRYINGSNRAALTTQAQAFLNGTNILTHGAIVGVELGTVRFFSHHAALAPPTFHPYLSGACARTIATQRRRVRPR